MKAYSVLIADASPAWRRNIADVLSRDKIFIPSGQAADCKAAIRMINALHPDIIILDLVDPAMEGLDVIEYVRSIEGYAPFLYVVTAFGSQSNVRSLCELDARQMSIKPVGRDTLLYSLRQDLFEQEKIRELEAVGPEHLPAIKEITQDLFRKLGARPFLTSTKCACVAVTLYVTEYRGKRLFGSAFYDDVAKMVGNGNDYGRVERNIRYASAAVRSKANPLYKNIFQYEQGEAMSNLTFIATLGDYIWESYVAGMLSTEIQYLEGFG